MKTTSIYAGQVNWQDKASEPQPTAARGGVKREGIPAVPVIGHTTTERTSKALKERLIHSVSIMGLGLFMLTANATLGQLVVLGGAVYFIHTKVAIWWHHG